MSADQLFEKTTRLFGNRVTRRSFIGRVAVGMSAVGAGGLGFMPSAAAAPATKCGCSNCGDSSSCGGSYCHGCPSGTCAGGSWYMCTSICRPSYYTRYQDCIKAASNCRKYCGKDGRAGCYYTTPYGSCGGHSTVYCRAVTCLGPASCTGNILGCA
jgi:hypothetical protein